MPQSRTMCVASWVAPVRSLAAPVDASPRVQVPNWSLSVVLVSSLVRRLVHVTGTSSSVLGAVAAVALAWWSVDELIRGVNPWRRLLGATVLVAFVLGSRT